MRRMTWLLVAAILWFASIADAQQDAKPKSDATGIFRITVDPDASSMNSSTVGALFRSQPVLKDAIAEVSAEAAKSLPEKIAKVGIVGRPGVGRSSATYEIFVVSFDERVPAGKLLEPLGQALEQRLEKMDVGRLRDIGRVSALKRDLQEIAEELAERQGALLEQATKHGLSPSPQLSAQKQMRIETELQNLDVQLIGLEARQRVIERQISKLAKTVANDPADEAIVKALQTRVEVRRAALAKLLNSNRTFKGSVTRADIEEAQAKLLEAEAELPKYRREAAEKAGGGRIAELKRRLEDTAIEMAEIDARSKALREQLDRILISAGKLEMKRLEVERLKRDYAETSAEFAKLRLRLKLYSPPSVQVIPVE